jgi:hypothetical protein
MKSILNSNSYSKLEWVHMKIPFSVLWLFSFLLILYRYSYATTPESIFVFFPDDFYLSFYSKIFLLILTCKFTYNYIFEKQMWVSLLSLSLISLFVFSLEDSNSDFNRNNMITGIFWGQFFAYSINKKYPDFNLKKYSVQFSVQIIAIGYTLSAISKLSTSGLNWITDGLLMPLQIMKTNYFVFANNGNIEKINNALHMIGLINKYSYVVMFILAFTLIIELFSLISIFNKKSAFYYGILLLLMHIGIYIVLDIAIIGAYAPMLIFMVNPGFLFYTFIKKLISLNNSSDF